jgi:hypothetical protein
MGGISGRMLAFIAAQFVTWAVHDGLQQYMFEQPGFAAFGVTMALFLQARVCGRTHARTRACAFGAVLP